MTEPVPNPHAADGIAYGHVFASYTEGTADTSLDLDPYPDERWLSGSVTFRPKFSGQQATATLRVPGTPRARGLVITELEYKIVNSRLVDRQDREGVWLTVRVGDIPVHWQATVVLRDAAGKVVLTTAYVLTPEAWVHGLDESLTLNLPDLIPNPSLITPSELAAIMSAQSAMERSLEVATVLEEVRPDIVAAGGRAADAIAAAGTAERAADRATGLAGAQDEHVAVVLEDPESETNAAFKRVGNATYESHGAVARSVDEGVVARRVPLPLGESGTQELPVWRKTYRPTALAATPTNNTGTMRAVDATNLSVTVTVPESRALRFQLVGVSAAPAGATLRWGLQVNGVTNASTVALVVTAGAGATINDSANHTVDGILNQMPDGSPLVPGARLTLAWAHSCTGTGSPVGYTSYGSNVGAAVMTATPVRHRVTDTPYAATVTGPNVTTPLWMCHDRTTLLGAPPNTWRLAFSTDEGATWANTNATFPSNVQHAREMDNGEVIVFVAAGAGGRPSAWVSSGWKANKLTATFTKTLDANGTWRSWSMDTHGPLVFAADYGAKGGPGDAAMGRYVYMSEDYGQTWTTIYDLQTLAVADGRPDGVDYHLHGVAYDPWWDAIWITTGDFIERSSIQVSFDRGKTWRIVYRGWQFTSLYAMPNCILFVTDMGGRNGVYRIPRTHPDGPLVGDWAYTADMNPSITILGNQCFRARSMTDAPLLMCSDSGTALGPGRLIATYDGVTFVEVWRDTESYINFGLRALVGPTVSGKYLGQLTRTSHLNAQALMVSLTPA